ncbi:ferredoxin-NADP reductase [Nocardioides mangrovicus]|uniref:ferredoxin--NADP(+) reductase n=1 Tax=Nocardioides mangrovicus TaxID=2478913 RepID=A0A3L8P1W7_9ACTN|nr:FAD-dependent oxidoreductase [Nocardioides mangrovicus]RLV49031.1 ferredoxin-NADP reductase [Nocardioides mangrovicus]
MAYVITQNCCKDASCVAACPVNCIHPVPDEEGFAAQPMLYVDPRVCIDCGACADACPVDAVVPADELGPAEQVYADLNAEHFAQLPLQPAATPVTTPARPTFREWDRPTFDWSLPSDFGGLDVAVVGTGPAGMYAAEHLLLHTRSRVTLYDRLPVPGGLVRWGVAPDHPGTKRIGRTFARLHDHPRLRLRLGVEVGRDVTTAGLAARHDAVVYAVGAAEGRRLGVPGEDLPGSLTAPEVVGWYNDHPEADPDLVRLDHERAVVVGTGNVALDVARVLTADPDALAATSAAAYAVRALREGRLREVVVLGRRGEEHAAWTRPERLALDHLPEQRIRFRFHASIARILGEERVSGVELTDGTRIDAGLVVTSIGYLGHPVPGLPFDAETRRVPHDAGRVRGLPGAYVVGWAKRGARGGIGDNRADAAETIRTLLQDAVGGMRGVGPGTAAV